jgi:hypothetical protein
VRPLRQAAGAILSSEAERRAGICAELLMPARNHPGLISHAAALSSLSVPRATIISPSSGNGRCSALAPSHGARIQTSRFLVCRQDYRHRFGMDGFDDRVRCCRQKAVD